MCFSRYRRDLAAARDRVEASGSSVVETRLGAIEASIFGEGPPVLLVHGVVGGCDQGRAMARAYVGDGFQIIAVSRFGYLRSPLPQNSSPAAQADLYGALLDSLEIRRAALVGTSAGGSSSLQFALRHPERCAALVLWSTVVPPHPIPARPAQAVMRAYFGSDFAFWATMTYARARMFGLMGTPRPVQDRLDSEQRQWHTEAMYNLMPVSLRVRGIMNDVCVSNPDLNAGYPLETISVPALMLHAVDDPMPPVAVARRMAARIPGARFIAFQDGGHLFLGHQAEARAEIAAFLREQAA